MDQHGLMPNPIQDRLQSGESILWVGKPHKKRYVMRGWWYRIPFGIFWTAFSIFWLVAVTSSGAGWFGWLWGTPFVFFGLYLLFGQFWTAAREVDNTSYVVTTRRIFIQTGVFRRHFTELNLVQLPYLQLIEHRGGLGTIRFGPAGLYDWMGATGWPFFGAHQSTPAFIYVENASDVYRIIENARNQPERW